MLTLRVAYIVLGFVVISAFGGLFEPEPGKAQDAAQPQSPSDGRYVGGTPTERGVGDTAANQGVPDGRYVDSAAPVAGSPSRESAGTPDTNAATAVQSTNAFLVARSPGAYGAAFDKAIVQPFEAANSIQVVRLDLDPSRGGKVVTEAPSGEELSVVELNQAKLQEACSSGAIVPIEPGTLVASPEGVAAADDYLSGGVANCGAATFAWSSVVAVRPDAFKKRSPSKLADVFDAKRYPGTRAFPKSPRYLVEMALLADGVKPAEVYRDLETDEGLARAFAKIDKLGNRITWTESSKGAMDLLESGEAAIAQVFSGRAFQTQMRGTPVRVIWDGQIYSVNYLAVSSNAPSVKIAREFVAFATAPKRLAAAARLFPYGPMRRSAIVLTDRHDIIGVDLAPHLPTSETNMKGALAFDEVWWSRNLARVQGQFDSWMMQRTLALAEKKSKKKVRSKRKRR